LVDGKNLAQEAGKSITYLRRYALAAILGLYADEDNDGNQPHTQTKSEGSTTKKEDVQNIQIPDKITYQDYFKLTRATLKWSEEKSKALLDKCGSDFEQAFVEAKKEAEGK